MHPVWAGLIKSSWLWLPPLIFLYVITYLFERGQAKWINQVVTNAIEDI